MFRLVIVGTACSVLVSASAYGQFLKDGDLDDLTVGTNPDCTVPAGAWGWPQNYISAGVCEAQPPQFAVVLTDDFDPGTPGNSLEMVVSDPALNIHLPIVFNQVINEAENPNVTVEFDIWVADAGTMGGSIYVGGDHGGGGFGNASDRGPQIHWRSDGTIIAAVANAANFLLVTGYPVGTWQSVRLEIDLAADTFDFFWGLQGDELVQFGDDVSFRSGVLNHLDRFTYVHFGGTGADSHSFIDHVEVSVGGDCPWDCGGDDNGDVGITDFLTLLAQWGGPGSCDFDGGGVGITDFLELLANWGPCP